MKEKFAFIICPMVPGCEREVCCHYLFYGQGVKDKFIFIICPMVPGCEIEFCFYHLVYGTRM